jgi:hypothetical protein
MLSHCHPMLVAIKSRHIAGTRAQEPLGGALASDDRQDRGESFRRRRQLSAPLYGRLMASDGGSQTGADRTGPPGRACSHRELAARPRREIAAIVIF